MHLRSSILNIFKAHTSNSLWLSNQQNATSVVGFLTGYKVYPVLSAFLQIFVFDLYQFVFSHGLHYKLFALISFTKYWTSSLDVQYRNISIVVPSISRKRTMLLNSPLVFPSMYLILKKTSLPANYLRNLQEANLYSPNISQTYYHNP